jgi:ribosomal protein S27AE
MINILCLLGIHDEMLVDRNYETAEEKVYRTFPQCRRCSRFGMMIAGVKYDRKTGKPTRL